jgi:NADH-ubiquinone oxidoreductase chain 2
LITIGYSLYVYVYDNKDNKENLIDENNSPIQLINQIKGYFHINPFIALSLAVTLFSFVGIPPIMGFFAKQMVLSAALDSGYVFMALVAILTSVIGAAYYLNLIKEIFFFKDNYKRNPAIDNVNLIAYIVKNNNIGNLNNGLGEKVSFKSENVSVTSSLSSIISIITLLLLLFIYIPGE